MAIDLSCRCGRAMQLGDAAAGLKILCPSCGADLQVPQNGMKTDDNQLRICDKDAPDNTQITPSPSPWEPSTPPDLFESNRDESFESRPTAFDDSWFDNVNWTIIGGAVTMLIAAGFFVIGLAVGILFVWPIAVLFAAGLASVAKGLLLDE